MAPEDINDHIGLDIGIFATTCWIAGMLGAPLVAQPISRLVIDCNRTAESSDLVRKTYDGRTISGNADISDEERMRRITEILEPYQSALSGVLDRARKASTHPPILMAMHSFTRAFGETRRNCDIGVIFEGSETFGKAFLENLTAATTLNVQHNEPYRIDFKGDYTIPTHTKGGELPYVELEICQDLISTCRGQRDIARTITTVLKSTLRRTDVVPEVI